MLALHLSIKKMTMLFTIEITLGFIFNKHHNNDEDPIYGSVFKLFVDDIKPIFKGILDSKIFTKDGWVNYTLENNEFDFYDLKRMLFSLVRTLNYNLPST